MLHGLSDTDVVDGLGAKADQAQLLLKQQGNFVIQENLRASSHGSGDGVSVPETFRSIGIRGLEGSPAEHMEQGAAYALDADVSSLRLPVVGACVADALEAGLSCTLVVRSKPDTYLQQLNTPAKFDAVSTIARRQLNVFVMQDEFQKKLFQAGPERMLNELIQSGVPDGSLVVFEHAADLLNLYDPKLAIAQVEAISAWCAKHRIVGLIVFSSVYGRDVVPPEALLDSMSGLACLEQYDSGLRIRFPYWKSGGNLTTGLSAHLSLGGDGYFVASPLGTEDGTTPYVLQDSRPLSSASSPIRVLRPAHLETTEESLVVVDTGSPRESNGAVHTHIVEIRDFESRTPGRMSPAARAGKQVLRARRSTSQDFSPTRSTR